MQHQSEAAQYIHALTKELAQIARGAKLESLTYLLRMTALHAAELGTRQRRLMTHKISLAHSGSLPKPATRKRLRAA